MATWQNHSHWTPKLAMRLLGIFRKFGAEDLPNMERLRKAALNNSSILAQRAEHAYDEFRSHFHGEEWWQDAVAEIDKVLTEAVR